LINKTPFECCKNAREHFIVFHNWKKTSLFKVVARLISIKKQENILELSEINLTNAESCKIFRFLNREKNLRCGISVIFGKINIVSSNDKLSEGLGVALNVIKR